MRNSNAKGENDGSICAYRSVSSTTFVLVTHLTKRTVPRRELPTNCPLNQGSLNPRLLERRHRLVAEGRGAWWVGTKPAAKWAGGVSPHPPSSRHPATFLF